MGKEKAKGTPYLKCIANADFSKDEIETFLKDKKYTYSDSIREVYYCRDENSDEYWYFRYLSKKPAFRTTWEKACKKYFHTDTWEAITKEELKTIQRNANYIKIVVSGDEDLDSFITNSSQFINEQKETRKMIEDDNPTQSQNFDASENDEQESNVNLDTEDTFVNHVSKAVSIDFKAPSPKITLEEEDVYLLQSKGRIPYTYLEKYLVRVGCSKHANELVKFANLFYDHQSNLELINRDHFIQKYDADRISEAVKTLKMKRYRHGYKLPKSEKEALSDSAQLLLDLVIELITKHKIRYTDLLQFFTKEGWVSIRRFLQYPEIRKDLNNIQNEFLKSDGYEYFNMNYNRSSIIQALNEEGFKLAHNSSNEKTAWDDEYYPEEACKKKVKSD